MPERNRFVRNVLIKALILFAAAANAVFAAVNLMPALGRIRCTTRCSRGGSGFRTGKTRRRITT